MELTGLKAIINNGGSFTDNTDTLSNSKTAVYKKINNLPGFANGTPTLADNFGGWHTDLYVPKIMSTAPTGVDASGITPNVYSQTTYGTSSPGQYFNSPAATAGAKDVHAPIGGGKSASAGGKFNAAGVGNLILSGVLFTGDTINAFSVNETGDEILKRQGQTQMSIGGVDYESQNSIDISKELEQVKKENTGNTLKTVGSGAALGAAAGSVIPGLGTAAGAVIGAGVGLITGIFGGEARKRKYRLMLAKLNSMINALLDSSRFSAQTKAILLQNAREYGNSESQYLYGAKDGKLPQYNDGTPYINLATMFGTKLNNKPTYSADGQVNTEPNAKVSKGEQIVNGITKLSYRIPGKKDNKDTEYAYLNPWDMVVTNKDGLSDYYAITGDYEGTKMMLKNRLEMAKNGRLPKCEEGWLGNAITSGLGAIGGLSQWLEAKNSSPRRTNSYRSNLYEGDALNTLASLSVNPYPIIQELRNAEARNNRAIDMSGGLTTGLRTLQRLASTTNTQRAIANSLANIQMQNNNYFADYAKTALSTGAANAQRAMLAYMWDEDMYAKAHAARQLGMQMGTYNILNALQQYYANEFKRQQFNDTMSLYRDDQKIKRDELLALLNNNSLAKNMRDYTKRQIGNYLISRPVINPTFDPTKTLTYKNATGKWLAGYNFNSTPSIPYINIPNTKKR